MAQFAGGVTADQLKPMALEEDAVATTPLGAEGTTVQLAPPLCVVACACAEAADGPNESNASTA